MTGGTKGCQTGEGAFARPHVNFLGGIDGDVAEPVTRVVDRFQAVNLWAKRGRVGSHGPDRPTVAWVWVIKIHLRRLPCLSC
jgi:hypothetical protein